MPPTYWEIYIAFSYISCVKYVHNIQLVTHKRQNQSVFIRKSKQEMLNRKIIGIFEGILRSKDKQS